MSETLYHPEVFIPQWFEMPTERVHLVYTKHALYACNNDRYGAIPVFLTIPLDKFELVELGVKDSKVNQLGIPAKREVSKIVVRGHFDDTRDITFALIPNQGIRDGKPVYRVKTVWFNLNSDKHKSLNRSRYAVA